MYRLGVMGKLLGGGGRPGEEDVGGGGDDSMSKSSSASLDSGVSSGSLCSSTISSLTDDDAESSPAVGDPTWSSVSSSSDTMQLDGEDIGPLYKLSPLLAHLPVSVRTGLSKYYKGKSQSFTSLSDVKCLHDLAKKTTSHISRTKASRSLILHDVRGPCSKMIVKKTIPRGSLDQLLSKTRSRDLLRRSGKPPAYQSKKELCSTYAS